MNFEVLIVLPVLASCARSSLVRVFNEAEWTAAGMDSTAFAAQELKSTLEGLAKHLFGDVECRWLDTYFPFTGMNGMICGFQSIPYQCGIIPKNETSIQSPRMSSKYFSMASGSRFWDAVLCNKASWTRTTNQVTGESFMSRLTLEYRISLSLI